MSLETERSDPNLPQESKWDNVKNNEKVQQAKQVSQQYLKFFGQVLKSPTQSSKQVGGEHLINTWITLGLIGLFTPLFFTFSSLRLGLGFHFTGLFFHPLLYIALILAAAVGAIALIFKLYDVPLGIKQAFVQFGTLIVPVPICLAVAIIFGVIGIGAQLPTYLLAIALMFIFGAMNVVILRNTVYRSGKFDLLYSLVIANVVIGYLSYKLIEIANALIYMNSLSSINSFVDFF